MVQSEAPKLELRQLLNQSTLADRDCMIINFQTIHIHYTGIVDITNEMRRILGRSANASSTAFGTSCKCIHVSQSPHSTRFAALSSR